MANDHIPQDLKVTGGASGLTERQIDEHYSVLYKGYVNKLNELEKATPGIDLSKSNATYSDLREIKKEEVFATNAMRLHEDFFSALGGNGQPTSKIRQWIEEDFGSFDRWLDEFKATGLAARGWVVLAFDYNDGRFHTYLTDIHSEGVWGCAPILILDVYEHAYFLDYGTARKNYIEEWSKSIDWEWVTKRCENVGVESRRAALAA